MHRIIKNVSFYDKTQSDTGLNVAQIRIESILIPNKNVIKEQFLFMVQLLKPVFPGLNRLFPQEDPVIPSGVWFPISFRFGASGSGILIAVFR